VPGRLDRRLLAEVRGARRGLAIAVATGLGAAVCIVVQAGLLARIVDRALLHHAAVAAVTPELVGLGAAFVVRALLQLVGEIASQKSATTITSELRHELLDEAFRLGPAWLAGERTGELSLTATRGINALNTYFGRYLPQATVALITPVGILAWLAAVDWPSALILLGLLLVIPPVIAAFTKRARQEAARRWRSLASLSARMLELLQGLPTLRAFGRQEHGRREVAEATESLRRGTMRTLRVSFLSALSLDLLAGLGTGLVAMVLGLRLLHGDVSLSLAMAVLLVSPEVFAPLRRASAEYHASAEGKVAAERVLDVLAQSRRQATAPHERPTARWSLPRSGANPTLATPRTTGTAPELSRSTIELVEVGVRFAGGVRALSGVNLVIAPKEHVLVRGRSGTGKSTLLSVLLGFVTITSGRARIGGVDLGTLDAAGWRELRRQMAWVSPRPYVFRGTLEDNLRMGNPELGEAAIERVLQRCGLCRVVSRLPEGLATPVGEGGAALSTGERQLVALARALLTDAPLLLLDEPLAHLDEETAATVDANLASALDGRTVLWAGHHVPTRRHFDQVLDLPTSPAAADPTTHGHRAPPPLSRTGSLRSS